MSLKSNIAKRKLNALTKTLEYVKVFVFQLAVLFIIYLAKYIKPLPKMIDKEDCTKVM